jgi:hypothetical protein
VAVMGVRGLIAGDDAQLDASRTQAAGHAKKKRAAEAIASCEAAIARVNAILVDRAFVQKKLGRFNTQFDRIKDAATRTKLDTIAVNASSQFSSARYDAANAALNAGFALMKKAR